uniref:ARAD1B12276p n=1 Tax=Blastobotrys adeninivorans TaxID=409370 RepID=A0A060T612_BLAAD
MSFLRNYFPQFANDIVPDYQAQPVCLRDVNDLSHCIYSDKEASSGRRLCLNDALTGRVVCVDNSNSLIPTEVEALPAGGNFVCVRDTSDGTVVCVKESSRSPKKPYQMPNLNRRQNANETSTGGGGGGGAGGGGANNTGGGGGGGGNNTSPAPGAGSSVEVPKVFVAFMALSIAAFGLL